MNTVLPTGSDDDANILFHPHYSSPDADVILRSLEGTLFRVHSQILRAASGLFKTIFSLPQPPKSTKIDESDDYTDCCAPTTVTISIYESASLLAKILPLITGKVPTQPLHTLSLSMLTRLLFLAEKWDAPGPISYIRNAINSSHSIDRSHVFFPYSPFSSFPPLAIPEPSPALSLAERPPGPGPLTGFFRSNPVQIYVLSRHFQWREEAERAAVSLLAMSAEHLEQKWAEVQEGKSPLEEEEVDATRFMVTNRDWESIMELRKRRCDLFKHLIDSRERFTAGNNPNYSCIRCGYAKLDNSSWDALKLAMMAEFEQRPLGDTLLAALVVPAGLGTEPQPDSQGTNNDGVVVSVAPPYANAEGTAPTLPILTCRKNDGDAWPELAACFKAKCPNDGCGAANYDPLATLRQIKRCVEELPWRLRWDE